MKSFNRGIIAFENILVLFFLIILFLIAMNYYHKYEDVLKERAAAEEVYHINSSIVVYYVLHGRFPEDIREITRDRQKIMYRETFFEKKYLEGIKTDKEGYPLDPWGNRYFYDKNDHMVKIIRK
jgi:competence protein ComGC